MITEKGKKFRNIATRANVWVGEHKAASTALERAILYPDNLGYLAEALEMADKLDLRTEDFYKAEQMYQEALWEEEAANTETALKMTADGTLTTPDGKTVNTNEAQDFFAHA